MMGRNTRPVIEKALNSRVLSYMKYDIQIRSVDARAYDSIVVPCASSETRGCTKGRDFIIGPLLTAVRPGHAAERGKPIAPWPCANDHPRPNSLSVRQRRPSPRGHISGSHRCSTTVFLFRFRRHGGLWFLPNCGVSQTGRNDRLPSVRAPTTRHGPVAVKDRWLSFSSAIGY